MPSEKTLKKNFTVMNGYLNANVEFLEVYPKPVCNGSFQVRVLPFFYRLSLSVNECIEYSGSMI